MIAFNSSTGTLSVIRPFQNLRMNSCESICYPLHGIRAREMMLRTVATSSNVRRGWGTSSPTFGKRISIGGRMHTYIASILCAFRVLYFLHNRSVLQSQI